MTSSSATFYVIVLVKSIRPGVSCKKGALKNFAKFAGKHLCQSIFFFKYICRLKPVTLLKKRLWHRCFPVNFAKLLRTTPFFTEHLWATASVSQTKSQISRETAIWLVLSIQSILYNSFLFKNPLRSSISFKTFYLERVLSNEQHHIIGDYLFCIQS